MKRWTEEEIQYVKDNWQNMTDAEMGKHLGRTQGSMRAERNKLQLLRGCKKNYCEQDGRSNHPLYSRWESMIHRCYHKSSCSYADYGGRGIKVCSRWLGETGFWNFVADMKWVGEIPGSKYELDRINNDFDYDPDNVRWVTHKENNNNTRHVKKVTAFGESKGVQLWILDDRCEVKDVKELYRRLRAYPPEIAMRKELPYDDTCKITFVGEFPPDYEPTNRKR